MNELYTVDNLISLLEKFLNCNNNLFFVYTTKDLEEIESDTTDPTDFLLTLIHFCNIATQERDLGIFLFSEG